ncbi:gpW family head-tail joining protein [Bradyrhizobium sp. RDM4]|uniref:gpW family head-tail joining protein n=1 Tax=Bradyrhizobium sp. RDM4 TaxID=3378765 RepID=UPI0038FD3197
MTDTTTLRAWLSQAETARHNLVTGSKVERLQHGDKSTQFTPANLSDLDSYIASLKSQLASADSAPTQVRRPINFTY